MLCVELCQVIQVKSDEDQNGIDRVAGCCPAPAFVDSSFIFVYATACIGQVSAVATAAGTRCVSLSSSRVWPASNTRRENIHVCCLRKRRVRCLAASACAVFCSFSEFPVTYCPVLGGLAATAVFLRIRLAWLVILDIHGQFPMPHVGHP